jgi:hypothetical protein
MSLEPLKDEGQELPQFRGLLIGVLDSREDVDATVAAINKAGVPDSEMLLLHGQDGVHLVERFHHGAHFFGDCPDQLFRRDTSVLADGKYVLGIKVKEGDQARKLAAIAKEHGGHGFAHFGMFVDTQFN